MSRQRDLAKNTAILTFGKICTQCVSFFLLPLYTVILDTSDYGTFDLMITYGSLLIPVVGCQFDQGIFRFLIECRTDQEEQIRLFSSVAAADAILILLYAVLLGVLSIFTVMQHSLFLTLYVVFHVIMSLLMQFARGLGNNKIYAMGSFISASTTVLFNVLTLVILKFCLEGLFVSTVCAQAVTIIYLGVVVKPWKYMKITQININILKKVVRYSIPLIPNEFSWWVINVSDRVIVSYILGVSINGIYAVANKFSNMFISFYNVFNLSWTEIVALHYEDRDRNEFLGETMNIMFRMFSGACFICAAIIPLVFPVMVDERYAAAYNHIIILLYAMLLRVVVGLYSAIYVATKETKKIAYTSAVAAVINIIVNLLLVHKIGLYAASLSSAVAFGIMSIIRGMDIYRKVNIRIARREVVTAFLMALVILIAYLMKIMILNTAIFVLTLAYVIGVNKKIIKVIAGSAIKKVTSLKKDLHK